MTAALLACVCAGAAYIASLPSQAATVRVPDTGAGVSTPQPVAPAWLQDMRRRLARFKDPLVAEKHGYRPARVCAEHRFTGPGGAVVGGMGYHYLNAKRLADPRLLPAHPEALVYVPTADGRLELGAAEFLKADEDQRIATTNDRPTLFSQKFQGPLEPKENGMPIHYALHVWLFVDNPNGIFEPWNPRVSCPASPGLIS